MSSLLWAYERSSLPPWRDTLPPVGPAFERLRFHLVPALSPTPWPKASNRRVLQSYSQSMRELLVAGYRPRVRPSGHHISAKFGTDIGGSIPPNLLALAHTESNSPYLQYCKGCRLRPHPARFPSVLHEFFIRLLSDPGDLVVDLFAGSCATGEAAERTLRRWICCELEEDYLKGAVGRFQGALQMPERPSPSKCTEPPYYRAYKPGTLWNAAKGEAPLDNGAISGLRGRASPRRNQAPPSALPRPSPA